MAEVIDITQETEKAVDKREHIIELKKPYTFERKEYAEIDLSGLEKLTIQDAIEIQMRLFEAQEEASIVLCDTTTSFARQIAAKASGLPVEFFEFMPIGLMKQVAAMVRNHITIDQRAENHVMRLKKPYTFKGEVFEEIDLSGVAELNSLNESAAENRLAREGFAVTNNATNYLYACCIASMATGKPEKFFTGLPLAELMKLRVEVNDADFFE